MRKLMAIAAVAVMMTAFVGASGGRPASPAGTAATEVGGKYDPKAARTVLPGRQMDRDHLRAADQARPQAVLRRGGQIRQGREPRRAGLARRREQLDAAQDRGAARHQRQDDRARHLHDVHRSQAGQLDADRVELGSAGHATIRRTPPKICGAYGYTPDKDVVRAPMTLGTLPFSVDQLAWEFTDMSDAGGKLTIMWDNVVASVPFKVDVNQNRLVLVTVSDTRTSMPASGCPPQPFACSGGRPVSPRWPCWSSRWGSAPTPPCSRS